MSNTIEVDGLIYGPCMIRFMRTELAEARAELARKTPTADELRELLSAFIDSGLDGHEVTKEQWERACLLCGRYCAPYVHLTTRPPKE